jgi:hypothetical protein
MANGVPGPPKPDPKFRCKAPGPDAARSAAIAGCGGSSARCGRGLGGSCYGVHIWIITMSYTSPMLSDSTSAHDARKPATIEYQPHRNRSAGRPLAVPDPSDHSVIASDVGTVYDVASVDTITGQSVSIAR